MDIRDYFNVFWKRKLIIFLVVVVAFFAAVIINYGFLPVTYRSTAKVLVEPRSKMIVFMSEQPRNMPPALDVATYVKMLKSLKVGEMAARKLGEKDPAKAEKAAAGLTNSIIVTSEEDTGIISLAVEGPNPKDITAKANAYADAFVELSKSMAQESIDDVMNYINSQLRIAKVEEQSKAAIVKEYKMSEGIIDPGVEATREEEIIKGLEMDKLQSAYDVNETSTRLAELQETKRKIEDAVLVKGADLSTSSDKGIDDTIQTLELKRLELSQRYVDGNEKITDIDKQIAQLKNLKKKANEATVAGGKISITLYDDVKQKIDDLKINTKLARERSDRIDVTLSSAKLRKDKYPDQEYELNKRKRDHEVAQALVDMLNKQLLETQVQRAQNPTKVQVLDKAQEQTEPVSPNRRRNIAIFLVFGVIVGAGIAFFLEEMEESIRTSDDVKNYLNLPVLGSIPYSAETINKLITDVPLKSPIAEAYRRLSFFTQLFCLDPPIKSLLVTSSKSDEGKSTTLANMAISMAQEGTKVLIVDTDLRRPMLHRMFGLDNSLGLSSILSGELEAEIAVSDLAATGRLPKESLMEVLLDRIIQPTNFKGLGVIPSGPLPVNSIELLRGERMLSFLRVAEKKADIILFDSPPAIHVIDAVVLSQILDGVLLVINSGRINREEALQVKYMVESTKTPIIGVALNNIEAASPDYYYYYYYGGYGYGSRQRRKRVKLKR